MTNKANRWIKRKLIELRNQFGGKCEDCDTWENLEFAHKEHTKLSGKGRGRKERYYDIKKHPDKYMLVCHVCHVTYDRERK